MCLCVCVCVCVCTHLCENKDRVTKFEWNQRSTWEGLDRGKRREKIFKKIAIQFLSEPSNTLIITTKTSTCFIRWQKLVFPPSFHLIRWELLCHTNVWLNNVLLFSFNLLLYCRGSDHKLRNRWDQNVTLFLLHQNSHIKCKVIWYICRNTHTILHYLF